MSIHRTLTGRWKECVAPEVCELIFHVSDLTVSEAEVMPLSLLLPIFEAAQPPSDIFSDGAKVWNYVFSNGFKQHRDYDLPAEVDQGLTWYQMGKCHRDGDKPAIITADGSRYWLQHGEQHRDGGRPAVMHADGRVEYWESGVQIR